MVSKPKETTLACLLLVPPCSTEFDYDDYDEEKEAEIVSDEEEWVIATRASEPSTPFSGAHGSTFGALRPSAAAAKGSGDGTAAVGAEERGECRAGGGGGEEEGEDGVPEWLRRQDQLLADIDSFG